jgi:integrase
MAKHEDVLKARQESVNFSGLIALIEADPGLNPTEKRDYISAVRRFTRYLGLDADNARAGIKAYRAAFEKFSPATAGISNKTWSNIRSDVGTVLVRYGIVDRRRPILRDLSPAWRALRDRAESADIRIVRGLSRLMHDCSARGIGPEEVTDEVVAGTHQRVIEHSFHKEPNSIYRDTCRLWNRARVEVPGWPDIELAVPRFDNHFSLLYSAFPISFQDEIERWEKAVSGRDLFAARAPAKPLKPRTVHHRKEQIRRFASALVLSGFPIEKITSMAVLFEPANFCAALQYHLDHRGGVLPGLDELASGMTLIGKNWVGITGDQLAEIRRLAKRVKCRKRGMTDKNMEIVRQFDDDFNVTTLVQFPDVLLAAAKKQSNPVKAALRVQTAVMIEIELATVIRLENLCNLRFDQHFDYSRTGRRGVVHMVIPDHTVKNDVPLEFELSRRTVWMLDLFRRTYLPRLAPGGTPYLFPGQKGGAKHPSTVEVQIIRTLRNRAGLRMTVHAFRHVAAFLYLKAHPGEHAFVSRLLGHKSIQTTIDFYCAFEAKFAALHYDKTILEPRRGGAGRRRR